MIRERLEIVHRMSERMDGKVASIALRTAKNGPMREVPSAVAQANAGLEGDLKVSKRRGITFIEREHWEEVCRELAIDLPWHTRRANVLVEEANLAELIGRTVAIGELEVTILGETEPCGNMDRIHRGLRQALTPNLRGGVHGRVERGGTLRVGDAILVNPHQLKLEV